MLRSNLLDGPGLVARPRTSYSAAAARFRPQVEALEDRTLATSTTLIVTPATITLGQQFTVTAEVFGSSSFSGTLTIFDNNSQIMQFSAVSPPTGPITFAYTPSTVGSHDLFAEFLTLSPSDSSFSSSVIVQVINVQADTATPTPTVTDVTRRVQLTLGHCTYNRRLRQLRVPVTLRIRDGANISQLNGPLLIVLANLPRQARLRNAAGITTSDIPPGRRPFIRLDVSSLTPGQQTDFVLRIRRVASHFEPGMQVVSENSRAIIINTAGTGGGGGFGGGQ